MCLKELWPCFRPAIDRGDDNIPTPSKLKPIDNCDTSKSRPKANVSHEESSTNSMPPNNGDPSKGKHMKPMVGVDTISQPTDPHNCDQTLMANDGARISYGKFTTKDQTETRNSIHGAADDADEEVEKKPQNKKSTSPQED